MTVNARVSDNQKYVICGACGESLCRRDRRLMWGGPPTLDDSGRRQPGREVQYVLAWEDGWRVVDGRMEMAASARDRLRDGNKPVRRDWLDAERLELTEARRRMLPAVCPNPECGAVNELKPKRLRVNGIAAY